MVGGPTLGAFVPGPGKHARILVTAAGFVNVTLIRDTFSKPIGTS